jgi:gas vesicle protein
MATQQGNSGGSVLVAFALGAAVGAAIALLYAPASGEETRRKLADKARAGKEKAEALTRDGREFIDRQRENLAGVVERGREAYEQVRKESV